MHLVRREPRRRGDAALHESGHPFAIMPSGRPHEIAQGRERRHLRIEHRDRRVVGEQMVGGKDVLAQSFVQRFEPPARTGNPSDQSRAWQIDAVPGKDLRLPIKWRVIAIFADQHLCEQRWRGQSAGDQPFRSCGLHNLIAAAASVFRASDAYDAQLRRYPVQHFADAFADGMERTTTTAADISGDVEPNVLARQMTGQWFAPRPRFERIRCDGRTALSDAGDVGLEVFKGERQLIGIQAFGATPELRPLQLLDDQFEALDLTVAAVDNSGHVADQTVQQSRIGRQILEIEPHVRVCSNMLIRRSNFAIFYAGFCVSSAGKSRSPDALGRTPVDAFNQHGELRRRQDDAAFVSHHPRPHKPALVNPLVSQLRMQTLRVHRCSLCGSRIHSTHCSGDGSPVSANDITGMANASCCGMMALRYGRFLRNGLIL